MENLAVGLECNRCTGVVSGSDDFYRLAVFTALKPLKMDILAVVYLDLEPLGKRIYNGSANAVQTAGHLISASAELTAGMQHCKYDSGRRDTLGMVYCGRNAASVIYNADNVIRKYRYVDLGAVTCESLVNRVINDLVNQMMQTTLARGADVHAGRFRTASRPFRICMSSAP